MATMSSNDETAVRQLYDDLLRRWNASDAKGFASLFMPDAVCVGFDGTEYLSAAEIETQLGAIFRDHPVASYVWAVREVRPLGDGVALLRGVAGMVPPRADRIKPERNAVQLLLACRDDGRWRIAAYQNTPARYDGRPEAGESLTRELQALVAGPSGSPA